jgi:hypothetical protein
MDDTSIPDMYVIADHASRADGGVGADVNSRADRREGTDGRTVSDHRARSDHSSRVDARVRFNPRMQLGDDTRYGGARIGRSHDGSLSLIAVIQRHQQTAGFR